MAGETTSLADADWTAIASGLGLDRIATFRVPASCTTVIRAWIGDRFADRALEDSIAEDMQRPVDAMVEALRSLVDELEGRRKREHPAFGMNHLGMAMASYKRLVEDAEKRGDVAGADAWRVVIDAVEHAEGVAQRAREQQTWRVT